MKRIPESALPSRESKFSLFALARERLLAAGYEPIGMDHFARPDDELAVAKRRGCLARNFQGYCVVPADDVLGLGISAIGQIAGAYFQNTKKLIKYTQAVKNRCLPVERGLVMSRDDDLRRHIIGQLMCNFRIDVASVERKFGVEFADYFAHDLVLLRAHERSGMVTIDRERIEATARGEPFVRNLAMCFDRYLRESGASQAPFSRTV
jgi:oxygen-independent coproporphyrinogen-3 oxidase